MRSVVVLVVSTIKNTQQIEMSFFRRIWNTTNKALRRQKQSWLMGNKSKDMSRDVDVQTQVAQRSIANALNLGLNVLTDANARAAIIGIIVFIREKEQCNKKNQLKKIERGIKSQLLKTRNPEGDNKLLNY